MIIIRLRTFAREQILFFLRHYVNNVLLLLGKKWPTSLDKVADAFRRSSVLTETPGHDIITPSAGRKIL